MEYWHPLYLVLTHFIFDWLLQPRRVAKEKQESMLTAMTHGLYVSVPLLFIFDLPLTILYALLHSLQDRHIYGMQDKLPFVDPVYRQVFTVAVDQMLHFIVMYLLYYLQYIKP